MKTRYRISKLNDPTFRKIFISAIFLLIGVAVFGGKYETYFDRKEEALNFDGSCRLAWAFGVAVVSLLLTFASCMLMVLEMLMGGTKDY